MNPGGDLVEDQMVLINREVGSNGLYAVLETFNPLGVIHTPTVDYIIIHGGAVSTTARADLDDSLSVVSVDSPAASLCLLKPLAGPRSGCPFALSVA